MTDCTYFTKVRNTLKVNLHIGMRKINYLIKDNYQTKLQDNALMNYTDAEGEIR